MNKFTFAAPKQLRNLKSFNRPASLIKLNGQTVGEIVELNDLFKIRLKVYRESSNANPSNFEWIMLKTPFRTLGEAKIYIVKVGNLITSSYDLVGHKAST